MTAIFNRMSEAAAFDAHQFVQNMTEAGFTPPQTEALVNAQRNVLNANLVVKADLNEATAELKADIAKLDVRITGVDFRITEVKAELKADIAKVESSLKQEIYLLKADIFKWMTGIMLAQATLIVGLIKLF